MKYLSAIIFLAASASACLSTPSEPPSVWLAWGDSYTIGEGEAPESRWPAQVAAIDPGLSWTIEYTARTGWTTGDLLRALEAKVYLPASADRVSLLIGVNNQYRGLDIEAFRADFLKLLILAVQTSRTGKEGVLILTIPDYGVTPFGENNPGKAAGLSAFNRVILETAVEQGIPVVDITPTSLLAAYRYELTASDGLHPSAEQYRLWAELVNAVLALER